MPLFVHHTCNWRSECSRNSQGVTLNIPTASGGHGGVDGMQQRCHQLEEWRLVLGHERRAARVTSGFCPALTLSSGKGIYLLSTTELYFKTSRLLMQCQINGYVNASLAMRWTWDLSVACVGSPASSNSQKTCMWGELATQPPADHRNPVLGIENGRLRGRKRINSGEQFQSPRVEACECPWR